MTLDEAREFLGIHRKVDVRLVPSLSNGRTRGRYVGIVRGKHLILIAVGPTKIPTGRTVEIHGAANGTLWHELTHALQCERDFDSDHALAYETYMQILALRLGVERLSMEGLHSLITGHERDHVMKIYRSTPWEQEADETREKFGHIKIQFVARTSRKR